MKLPLSIICMILLAGCSKDQGSKDREAPLIDLVSPVVDQRFNAGETVIITGSIQDNGTISELHVHVSNLLTGTLLYDIHRYPAAGSYTIRESFEAKAGISYKIQVIAKDNSANEGRISVEISTN